MLGTGACLLPLACVRIVCIRLLQYVSVQTDVGDCGDKLCVHSFVIDYKCSECTKGRDVRAMQMAGTVHCLDGTSFAEYDLTHTHTHTQTERERETCIHSMGGEAGGEQSARDNRREGVVSGLRLTDLLSVYLRRVVAVGFTTCVIVMGKGQPGPSSPA